METLLAFHGDKTLKSDIVSEVKRHMKMDLIKQGTYGSNDKPEEGFCGVGCSIHSLNLRRGKNYSTSDHKAYEKELGIPMVIARLEDKIFEGMDNKDAKRFPLRFLESVPVGADLSLVFPKMMICLLKDCRKHARTDGRKAINDVIKAFERVVAGETVEREEWRTLRSAAASAAHAAAYAADAADAAYAADAAAASAAADAADYSAYTAAAAAAAAYAAYASADAREKAYKRYANYLIRLLKDS